MASVTTQHRLVPPLASPALPALWVKVSAPHPGVCARRQGGCPRDVDPRTPSGSQGRVDVGGPPGACGRSAGEGRERVGAPGPAPHTRRGTRGAARAAPCRAHRALRAAPPRTRAARLPAGPGGEARPRGLGGGRTADPGTRARGPHAPRLRAGGRAEGGLRPVSSRPTRAGPEQPLLCTRRGHRPRIDGGRGGLAGRCELSGGGRAVPGRRRPRAGRRQMAARPSPRPRAPFYGGGCSLPEQCHFFMNEVGPALECVCHSAA